MCFTASLRPDPGGAASEKDPGITCQLDDKGRARMTAGVQNQSDAIEDAKEHTLHRSDLTACHMDDLTSSCKFNKVILASLVKANLFYDKIICKI